MKIFDSLREKSNSGDFPATDRKSYKDILGSILIPTGCLCMVIAVTLFLGGLFHKIQPWFSIGQGLLALLFGLYCFWYAHRISEILSTSHKKAWSNYDFRFSIKAGVISVITAPVAFFVAALKGPGLHWVSIMLFILGFGLYCLSLYLLGFFKAFWEFFGETDEGSRTEKSQSTDPFYLGRIVGYSVVGLLYVAIFLPLTLWSTAIHDLDSVDVLLFARLTEASAELGILGQLKTILNFSNTSHLFAFGVFYGVFCIIRVLMGLSLRKEGWLDISIMSNGLAGGYVLTIWVKHLLGAPLTSSLLFSSALSFGYVFLLYYGLRSLVDIISRWGIRSKYEHIIGGIQSMGTGWILSRLFGDQAIVFSGVTFFICTFIVTSVFEATIGRLIKRMHPALPDQRVESIVPIVLAMARERQAEFWESVRLFAVITGLFPFLVFGVAKLVIMAL